MPSRCLFLLCLGVALGGGCARKSKPTMPPLHPVTGVVCNKTAPIAGGSLHVVPQRSHALFVVTADVGPDGRFELTTLDNQNGTATKHPGAPEGTYKVTFLPDSSDEEIEPTELVQVFKVEPGCANEWKIDLAAQQLASGE
jgi:hypothetical protein